MKRISMVSFRRETHRAISALRRGERLLLTHRGRPIARLEPVVGDTTDVTDDALLHVEDYSVDGPGGTLTNADIDRVIHGV